MSTNIEKLEAAADELIANPEEVYESLYHDNITILLSILVHKGYEVWTKKAATGSIKLKIAGEAQLSDW